jgi:hypothetical protein
VVFLATPQIVFADTVLFAQYDQSQPLMGSSLQSYRRPLEGGLQIAFRRSGQAADRFSACTLGFNALLNDGTRAVITNSHCSDRSWDFDNTTYYQPVPGFERYLGYEYRDPNGTSCGFLSPNVCRDADAAAMYVDPLVQTHLGYLARTVNRVQGPWEAGSLSIDGSNPRFSVSGKQSWVSNGQVVDKVGRTTGWTHGGVFAACEDVSVGYRSWSKLRCQALATLTARPGDSGSPVFRWSGGETVWLVTALMLSSVRSAASKRT